MRKNGKENSSEQVSTCFTNIYMQSLQIRSERGNHAEEAEEKAQALFKRSSP